MTTPRTIASITLQPGNPGVAWQIESAGPLAGLSPAHLQRLNDILAALAGWALAAEPAFMALLPLAEGAAPALLLKAGRKGGHGMILPPALLADLDGRAEHLLPLLPATETATGFASPALPVPARLPPLPINTNWPDIGIAWRDMVLVTPQSSEVVPALVTVLAQMRPPEQARRITGWATTAMMPAVGGFDPWTACPLLVLGPGRVRPAGLPHKLVTMRPSGDPPETATAPPAFAAWRALRAAMGKVVPDWEPAFAIEAAPALLQRLAADLPQSRTAILAALLLHDAPKAATLLAAWLATDGASGIDPAMIDQVPAMAMLDGLDTLQWPARALPLLPLARLEALAAALANHPAGYRPIASDLAARLALVAPQFPALPAIVARRLSGPTGIDLERMATPQVIEALGPGHAALAMKLTSGGVARPTATWQMLATSLAAVRVAARAR